MLLSPLTASTTTALRISSTRRCFSITLRTAMPSETDRPNASGMPPSETRALPTRQPREDEQPIIKALKELYTVTPSESTYAQYAEDAVFHDPVSIAKGVKSIRAQFNALPALFPRAEIRKFNVLDADVKAPGKLLIDQVIAYYRSKDAGAEPFKELDSLLTIERDSSGLIKSHFEEWDHKPEVGQQGFAGDFHELRKTLTAKLTNAMADQTPPQDRK